MRKYITILEGLMSEPAATIEEEFSTDDFTDDTGEEDEQSFEDIGQALNTKDMQVFLSAYKKLCAGAIESISAEEAKELAEIMLALFRDKIEGGLEEGAPVAPTKPLTPADMRARKDAKKAADAGEEKPVDPKISDPDAPDPTEVDGEDVGDPATAGERAEKFLKGKNVKVG